MHHCGCTLCSFSSPPSTDLTLGDSSRERGRSSLWRLSPQWQLRKGLSNPLIASHLCLQSKGHVSPSRAKAEVSFISRARVVVSVGREEGVVSADRPLPSPVPLRLSFCLSKVGRDHMRKVTKCTKFHSPKESYHVRVSLWIEGNRTTSETFGSSSLYSSWFLSCSYPTFFEKRPSVWTPLPRRLP